MSRFHPGACDLLLRCAKRGSRGGVRDIENTIDDAVNADNDPRRGANGRRASRQENQRRDFDEGRDRIVRKIDGVETAFWREPGAGESRRPAPQWCLRQLSL